MDRRTKARRLGRSFSRLAGALFEIILLGVSLTITPHIRAQASPPSRGPQALKVSVDLVLVDVVVKDKKGQHVKGLRQENFTVLEDGVPQGIATFSLEDTEALSATRNVKSLPKGLYTNRPEYRAPPGPVTILLLDGLNTEWRDQAYMRAQVLNFLKSRLRPGERMAILALDASLHVLQDFTDAPEILKAAGEGYTPEKSTQLLIADVESRLPPRSRMADTPVVASAMYASEQTMVDHDHG
jgi:VWFA-related protein